MADPREMMTGLLRFMREKNASDLHLGAHDRPYARINGIITATDFPALSHEENEALILSFLTEEGKKAYAELKTLDFAYGDKELGRFRVNIYQQRGTIAAAIRRLPATIPSFQELGLPVKTVSRFCHQSHGLILVCGPVGSGKTTTLASMIDFINRNRACHVLSIEDPVEYVHLNIKSIVHQREVRRDTPNFIDALKYTLREDPDIVVIGEMRDLETIMSAVTIAETGHLVLATLHTGDTSESIRRIIDVFPSSQQPQIVAQLSSILTGVVNQMLIPTQDSNGRVLATEVLVITPAIQNIIRENKIEQIYSHIQMGIDVGMHTMNQSLYELVCTGKISEEIAFSKTRRVKELMRLLEK